ncbi:MAG: RsmB/NOP family class I SAM-dependent RNA methyltransferase, partial [Clostridiales bacterium]|nr:RsmB/NOP family class I SAM-dependent RNA methyltransferase [Clostridiales bacterium]
MKLPEKFIAEADSFFARHDEVPSEGFYESFDKTPLHGVRFSRTKTAASEHEELLKQIDPSFAGVDPVEWCDGGYYLSEDTDDTRKTGRNPLYHAGVFYPQEPSAMLPAQVLSAKPGEIVLDMCAAPGGKACRIGEDLKGEGLLVANEINYERSKALLRNIERSGITNSVILNENPDNIANRLPGFFDKILIDAPCSGEGMFRRDRSACASYEKYGPDSIVPVQKTILEAADKCLHEGGEIVYSTCTFCEEEDELMISSFMEKHPSYRIVPHPEIKGITHNANGTMRIWPHLNRGDGHFCAHLVKGEKTDTGRQELSYVRSNKPLKASERRGFDLAREFLSEILTDEGFSKITRVPFTNHAGGVFLIDFDENLFRGLKVCKTGLYIGDCRLTSSGKSVFAPSNSIALALTREMVKSDRYLSLAFDDPRLERYL